MGEQANLFPAIPNNLRSPGIAFVVYGTPAPQGSKKAYMVKGRPVVVDDSKRTRPWREAVKQAALDVRTETGHETYTCPVRVLVTFYLPRPAGHYGTGRNAGTIKASAPTWPAVRPDVDKLARSTLDALKDAGIYRDDALIVSLSARKEYPNDLMTNPGAVIELAEASSHARGYSR